MYKNRKALLAVTVSCWLSTAAIASAEDKIYYGFGDSNNTGDISSLNWVLNSDYSLERHSIIS